MPQKKNKKTEILRLKKQLQRYQKQYNGLIVQSPHRWWHDEYFDNQLKLFEKMIEKTKSQLTELKRK